MIRLIDRIEHKYKNQKSALAHIRVNVLITIVKVVAVQNDTGKRGLRAENEEKTTLK